MIRYLSRRWADPVLRRDNEQLRDSRDNARFTAKTLFRKLQAQREATKTQAQLTERWKRIAEQHRAELDAMKEKT